MNGGTAPGESAEGRTGGTHSPMVHGTRRHAQEVDAASVRRSTGCTDHELQEVVGRALAAGHAVRGHGLLVVPDVEVERRLAAGQPLPRSVIAATPEGRLAVLLRTGTTRRGRHPGCALPSGGVA